MRKNKEEAFPIKISREKRENGETKTFNVVDEQIKKQMGARRKGTGIDFGRNLRTGLRENLR